MNTIILFCIIFSSLGKFVQYSKCLKCSKTIRKRTVRLIKHKKFRLERLEHLAEKFRRKCGLYEEWVHGKEDALRSSDWRSCGLYKIKVLLV